MSTDSGTLQRDNVGHIEETPLTPDAVTVVTTCNCEHEGDIVELGAIDVFDIVALIDYVFAGGTQPPKDPSCPHTGRGGANCDGFDDVFDIVHLIGYTFSGGPAPCNPCACSPYPTNCP